MLRLLSHRISRHVSLQAKIAHACANRWTDNVWTLKSHLCSKFGRSPGEVDAMLGIDDMFDYLA